MTIALSNEPSYDFLRQILTEINEFSSRKVILSKRSWGNAAVLARADVLLVPHIFYPAYIEILKADCLKPIIPTSNPQKDPPCRLFISYSYPRLCSV